MKKTGYYSSGQFARMAKVTVRTIRFYDKQNILKPSYLSPSGARFYTDSDFVKLQQILLLKYLGFSLDDIRGMIIDDVDVSFLRNSLTLQRKLVADRIEQMQLVEEAIDQTVAAMEEDKALDWSHLLHLIHLTGMEKSYKSQYANASNIAARIRLHRDYSTNPMGWFPWMFQESILPLIQNASPEKPIRILELGCGDGSLWKDNLSHLPEYVTVTLSDISEGMIRDVRRDFLLHKDIFTFDTFDCHRIPYEANTFDLVIANHLLFYCEDIPRVCQEVLRVLRPGGAFLCSTYGDAHMQEITSLVQEFDQRILLSAENLYDRFGLDNGSTVLAEHFTNLTLHRYEDAIVIDQAEPLVEYILSCHGNQNQHIVDRYHEFRQFVERKVQKKYRITKDAGFFLCFKPN